MVPFAHLQEAADALAGAGVDIRTHVSPGIGHGIAPDGLSLALGFIRERFGIAG
jgi:phospholipase/carboxylesterase